MKETQNKPAETKNQYTVSNTLINMYLSIMFSFFPLFLTNQYTHARLDKYWFYMIATGVMVISVGACMFMSQNEAQHMGEKRSLMLPLSLCDVFMLAFVGLAAISTVLSPYPLDALTGAAGRNNGLVLLLMYTLMYFAITRNYVQKDYVFVIYLCVSGIVALLTVLNFFYIDPLHMLDGYDAATAEDFGSTIGNKNMIAAFMCVYLPVSVMMFVVTEKKAVRYVSAAAILFAYTGLICADSTSDLFGLFIIIPVMAIFCARSFTYIKRYLLALTILFTSGKVLQLFATMVGNNNKGFEFMQEFLVYHPLMFVPIAVCGIGYLLMALKSRNEEPKYPAKAVQIILIVLFSIGIIAAVGSFCYFSFIDKTTDLGKFKKILRFDDYWGTHRGFMWRVSFEEYSRYNFIQRLFGMGPDTVYHVLQPHFAELSARFGDSSTDCSHNEYINYLLTQGALGLTAYLALMVAAIVRAVKAAKHNPIALVFISAVICYLAQSTVNLYNPIITPALFIFLSLSEAIGRQELPENFLKSKEATTKES